MKVILTNTISEFDSLLNQIHTELKASDTDYIATSWQSDVVVTTDDRYIIYTDDRVENHCSQEITSKIQEIDESLIYKPPQDEEIV
jgi:hypothetical protein